MLLFQLIQIFLENPIQGIIALIVITFPLLISVTIHEWAHGFAAHKFGDPTPSQQGRLSFNPLAHLDPVGTLMLFIVGIGWAKPVEINPAYIRDRFKLMFVAFAGPLSNFILATILVFIVYMIYKITGISTSQPGVNLIVLVVFLLELVIRVNLVLGMFNLIPIPPLDGSNMVRNLLPEKMAQKYFSLAPYSLPILLVLVFTGAIRVLFRFAETIQNFLIVFFENVFGRFF